MHALVACPARRGFLHHKTVLTIYTIQRLLNEGGHSCELGIYINTEIIDARNTAATQFLDSNAEIMIGIDDDVGADDHAIIAMINANVDYISACIPQRQMDLDAFAEGVRKGMDTPAAMRFAAPLVDGPGTPEGISEVERVGTGFFVIRRAPLERLVETGAAIKKLAVLPVGNTILHGFYDHIYDEDGGRLSEDYSFCRRVREAGFPVHAYKGPGISHSGEATYTT